MGHKIGRRPQKAFEFQKAEETKSPTKPQTEKLITQETTEQSIGNNNDCPIQMSGSDGNSFNCSTNNTDTVEKQENIERKIVLNRDDRYVLLLIIIYS